MMEFRETFKKKLDDHSFRDAIYDLISELIEENEKLRAELARFQAGEDEYVMTEAEAEALRDTNNRNPPKIPARQLREVVLDELTKQAQELDMGYGEDDK